MSVEQQRIYAAQIHCGSHKETGVQFPTDFSRTYIENNDRRQCQDLASEYILKEIYFTPQNKQTKKKIGIRDVVHWECIDNCSLHFFLVSAQRKMLIQS